MNNASASTPLFSPERIRRWRQLRAPAWRNVTPESLARTLDDFQSGWLRPGALLFDAIERRDDVVRGVALKRKLALTRYQPVVEPIDATPEALADAAVLRQLWRRMEVRHALEGHVAGGIPLLLQQMMDAIGKGYAVHHLQLPSSPNDDTTPARFTFVPLWCCEARTGTLRLLDDDYGQRTRLLEAGHWMVTTTQGLMEATAVAVLFKSLCLRDWLIYCERNGMPGVTATTDAAPGTREWEAARQAVESFGAEFHALLARGTELAAVDLGGRGTLPYPALVERIDRALLALWRGTDLSTLSARGSVGASLQGGEVALLEAHDAALLADTLHAQVERPLARRWWGREPLARLRLRLPEAPNRQRELEMAERLARLGAPLALDRLVDHLGLGALRRTEPGAAPIMTAVSPDGDVVPVGAGAPTELPAADTPAATPEVAVATVA